MRVIVLGSGASSGTPSIDAGWGKCSPENPKNRRTRPSVLIESAGGRILIDTPPDLREQLLAADVARIDAVLYTHTHADHLHGIDDLRAVNRVIGEALPIFGDAASLREIKRRFDYVFAPLEGNARHFYKPTLVPNEIRPGDCFVAGGASISAFEQHHGFSATLGFRCGGFAYSTDVVDLPEVAFDALIAVDVWVIGVLTEGEHATHCGVAKALGWIERVRPRRAVLTHIGLDLDHDALMERLPPGVEVAFDGMVLDVAE